MHRGIRKGGAGQAGLPAHEAAELQDGRWAAPSEVSRPWKSLPAAAFLNVPDSAATLKALKMLFEEFCSGTLAAEGFLRESSIADLISNIVGRYARTDRDQFDNLADCVWRYFRTGKRDPGQPPEPAKSPLLRWTIEAGSNCAVVAFLPEYVRGCVLDELRRQASFRQRLERDQETIAHLTHSWIEPPEELLVICEEQAEYNATIARFREHWSTLSKRDQELLELYYGKNLRAEEVARLLGMSEGNVYSVAKRRKDEIKQSVLTQKGRKQP